MAKKKYYFSYYVPDNKEKIVFFNQFSRFSYAQAKFLFQKVDFFVKNKKNLINLFLLAGVLSITFSAFPFHLLYVAFFSCILFFLKKIFAFYAFQKVKKDFEENGIF